MLYIHMPLYMCSRKTGHVSSIRQNRCTRTERDMVSTQSKQNLKPVRTEEQLETGPTYVNTKQKHVPHIVSIARCAVGEGTGVQEGRKCAACTV